MAVLPTNVLAQILKSLYIDFFQSDECIDIGKHHCSLLHPCISVSKSTSFNPIYTFRLVSSDWNKAFLSTAKLDRLGYDSHRTFQRRQHDLCYATLYDLLRGSVALRRYRAFRKIQYGTSLNILLVSSFFSTDYY